PEYWGKFAITGGNIGGSGLTMVSRAAAVELACLLQTGCCARLDEVEPALCDLAGKRRLGRKIPGDVAFEAGQEIRMALGQGPDIRRLHPAPQHRPRRLEMELEGIDMG